MRIITCLILLLTYINTEAQIREIDIFKTFKTCQNINLSQFANNLSYVRLDDAKQTALLSRVTLLTTNKSLIAIYDRPGKKLFLFNTEGSYLKTLLNWGKGPNEFIGINSIDLNINNELLVLSNWNQIYILNSNGNVSEKFTIKGNAPLAKWITQDIIAVIYYYPFFLMNDGYEITFIDRKGKILSRTMPNTTKNIDFNDFMPKYSCGWNQDTLYYWNEYHDTVYSITKKMKVIPRVMLRNNGLRYSVESLKHGAKMNDSFNTNTYYILDSYQESGDFTFISGVYQQHRACLLINRKTGIGNNIFDDYGNEHYIGLKNDLDGGFDFWPSNCDQAGILTMPVDPNELRETFTKHFKMLRPVNNLSQRDSVQKNVIERITEMDNPILMQITK